MFAQRGTNSDPFPLRSRLLVSFAKGGGGEKKRWGKKKEVESTSPIRWAAGVYVAVRVTVSTTALMSPSRAAAPGAGRSHTAFSSVQIYVLGLGRAFVLSLRSNAACANHIHEFHVRGSDDVSPMGQRGVSHFCHALLTNTADLVTFSALNKRKGELHWCFLPWRVLGHP